MSELFLYLIKANIALCLFYLAYRLGLRRLTFYTLNRYFLLSGIVFSSLFPLVDVNDFVNRHETLAQQAIIYLPDFQAWQPAEPEPFSFWTFMEWIFWAGVAVMAVRLIVQLVSLLFLHRKTHSANILDRKVRLMPTSMNPFSFFRHIYVNPSLHGPEELKAILQHEAIHVKEWHSADVLMSELNQVFYWFNPGAWLMKTAVKENLEFLTDRTMLRMGADRKAYQYSLVQVSAAQYAAGIANNFNFSHLKNRIKMMNKRKSSRLHITRYAILGSIVCGVLLSLNFTKAGTVVQDAVKDVQRAIVELKVDTVAHAKPVVVEEKKPVVERTLQGAVRGIIVTDEKIREEIAAAPQVESAPADTVVPGRPVQIRLGGIRDTSKVPLIILDGKVLERTAAGHPLERIEPNAIESITVLKDENATAIYGTKAKNGVILITSKSAKAATKGTLEEVTVVGYGKKDKDAVELEVGEDGTRSLRSVVVVGYGTATQSTSGTEEITVVGRPATGRNTATTLNSSENSSGGEITVVGRLTPGKNTATTMSATGNSGLEEVTVNGKPSPGKSKATSIGEFKIYPNPTSDQINLSFYVNKAGKGYIEVTDANGKPVYQKSLTDFQGKYTGQIDLGGFPAGIYYVVIVKDDTKATSKVVKK